MNTNLIKTSSKTINEYSCQLTDKLEYHRLEIIDNGIIKHFNEIRVINVPYPLNYKVVIKQQHRKHKDKYTYQLIKPKDIKDINHINLDNIGLLTSRYNVYDYKLETLLQSKFEQFTKQFEFTELEYDLRKLKKLLRKYNIRYVGIRQYSKRVFKDDYFTPGVKYISLQLSLTKDEITKFNAANKYIILNSNTYLKSILSQEEFDSCKL